MKNIDEYLVDIKKGNESQAEFLQAVEEVIHSVQGVLEGDPKYENASIIERITEPERQIIFKISWVDDSGKIRVNTGYNVQFNGVLGPFKGGIRFHPSVNLSIIKFLSFEQTFKNALTGINMGGAKAGSDFDPKGKSEEEIKRFCESFMFEMFRHIGSDIDVPAGDIGVGGREIGYLFGTFRRLTGEFDNGAITGKSVEYGGSSFRPEATGYGIAYFADSILKYGNDSFNGKTIAVSGYGQVAAGVIKKVSELGAKVITISGSDGYVLDKEGISGNEKLSFINSMKDNKKIRLRDYAETFGAEFHEKKKPWEVPADIVIPAATQNEIGIPEAELIISNGTKYVIEGANMPCTNEAVTLFVKNGIIVAPAKAANAGGVAISGMEMAQNSRRLTFTDEEMETMLKGIMSDIHSGIVRTCEEKGLEYDLINGANILAFQRVADAMISQGVY